MKIDPRTTATITGTRYPPPFDTPCRDRIRQVLGDAAGFRAGNPDGHHLQNRSAADALVLEVGSRLPEDEAHYPDIDLHALAGRRGYAHKDGRPYENAKPRNPATGR